MTRTVIAPSFSTRTVDQFLGMTQDRSGIESEHGEFYDLSNVDNNSLRGLCVRLGSKKVYGETHTGSATKTRGLHNFINDAGTETSIKSDDTGKVYKSTGGSWTEITASAPGGGFTDADMSMATIGTKDTGGSSSTTGTSTDSTSTSMEDSGSGWTKNAYVQQVLTVGSEIKLIGANDTENIFVKERFDTLPDAASFTVVDRAQEFFLANGTEFYKCDGTTFTALQTSDFAYAFSLIESHRGRLWGVKGTRLHWSDVGVGEHFSRNSWQDFQTPIQAIKSMGDVLVIYERNRISVLFGDNPDNFFIKDLIVGVGCASPKTVQNYPGYQFFLSKDIGVGVITFNSLQNPERSVEPTSISVDYLNTDILGQTSANIEAACAVVNDHLYIMCIDNDWYVLNIQASARTGFRHWVWSKRNYPDAIDANVLGLFGTTLVSGAQDDGQVYELDAASTYDDDGTAIAYTIEKQDWMPGGEYGAVHKYIALNVSQPTAASSVTQDYSFDAEGSTYGSAIESPDLNATGPNHRIEITGNPSDVKNTGRTLSYKISGSTSVIMPEIQQINLMYYPGTLR